MMEQTLIHGFEPTEQDMIERALRQPLEAKVTRAISLLRTYQAGALALSEKGYHLAFSGGKDSCVIKQLAIEAGVPFESVYSNTTIDPPELIRFLREKHPDVRWVNPKIPLLRRVTSVKGPPTRNQKWCCGEYKEQSGNGQFKVIGVRIAESARRAKLWKEFVPNRDRGNILAPIAYWTDDDVWKFIRSRDLPHCCLYDQGFTRLGCVGCPEAGAKQQTEEFARWPGYEAAWKRAIYRYYEKWVDVPTRKGEDRYFVDFGSAEGLWRWWRSGKAFVNEPELCVYEEMMNQR